MLLSVMIAFSAQYTLWVAITLTLCYFSLCLCVQAFATYMTIIASHPGHGPALCAVAAMYHARGMLQV